MKNRITEYFIEKPKFVQSRIEDVRQNLDNFIEGNKQDVIKNFQNDFNRVFKLGAEIQIARNKGPIQFICISILRSSLITKKYQLRIDLYDENFYFDQVECSGILQMDFVFQWINDDVTYFTKCARGKLVRIQDAEMINFMQEYQEQYFDFIKNFCVKHIDKIVQMKSWQALKKSEQVNFIYGEFLDEGTPIVIEEKR